MANQEHVKILMQGVDLWHEWRKRHPDIEPDLHEADLQGVNLRGADLHAVDLMGANLREAILNGAILTFAQLGGADLREADLGYKEVERDHITHVFAGAVLCFADLSEANLSRIRLVHADLSGAILNKANLSEADLAYANLTEANLKSANLTGANLRQAVLFATDLNGADLHSSNLQGSSFEAANLSNANLSGSMVSGINATGAYMHQTLQSDLFIPLFHLSLKVDELGMAQFISFIIDHPAVWKMVQITRTNLVLLLGCDRGEQSEVIKILKTELQQRGYTPVICDFQRGQDQAVPGQLATLIRVARFVIVDTTGIENVAQELGSMFIQYPSIPVLSLSKKTSQDSEGSAEGEDFSSVQTFYQYRDANDVEKALNGHLIEMMEQKL